MGFMLASSAVHAQVNSGDKLRLLGRDYTVVITPRTGTFKNGATVNLQKPGGDVTVDTMKANLAFAPGTQAYGSGDRLFVVAATQGATGVTSDGFYMLQGTDARGVFAPEFSNAHVFFRGDLQVHGRIQSIAYINDTDTGAMKDRNLATFTFTDANYYRWYDLSDLLAIPLTGRTDQDALRNVHAFARLRGDEYLIIAATGDPNWDEAAISGGTLYHVRITLPADLTKEAPDSIKVELLSDPVDVPGLNLGRGESKHIFGLAVGREVNGANVLYMADYAGNLFTQIP